MHLWTDYEGKTVAGYLIGRLNRSEGRNAFFATTASGGERALLRLTEAHFDESELIRRWRSVANVTHPNLQAIKRAGQTMFDGLSLACCLLEPVDGSLSDALRDHVFSVDEVKEVAEAVGGALASLHAADLVHEHVDASNVFALGEVVKLRSDCCRECAGEFEADTPEAREALRQGDVRDLGLLLLRCLGLVWQGSTPAGLPKPFDRIIPGALSGTLTAQEIVDVLLPPKPVVIETVAATPVAVPTEKESTPTLFPEVAAEPLLPPSTKLPPTVREARLANPLLNSIEGLRNQSREFLGTHSVRADLMRRLRPMKPRSMSRKTYVAAGAAAAVLGAVLWFSLGSGKPAVEEHYAANIETKPEATPPPLVAPQPSTKPAASQAVPARTSVPASGERTGWHVIAYTYRYEQQAKEQVMKLQQKYVNLHPQVFTPTGRAPYFVALGNASDASTAMDLRDRARQVGLPRDTYARNF